MAVNAAPSIVTPTCATATAVCLPTTTALSPPAASTASQGKISLDSLCLVLRMMTV